MYKNERSFEITFKNTTKCFNFNGDSFQSLKEHISRLFEINPIHDIQLFIHNMNQATKIDSFDPLKNLSYIMITIYVQDDDESLLKKGFSKEYCILNNSKISLPSMYVDQKIQVDIEKNQENREIQTNIIKFENQSSNTSELFKNSKSDGVFYDLPTFKAVAEYEIKKIVCDQISSDFSAQQYYRNSSHLNEKIEQLIQEKFRDIDKKYSKNIILEMEKDKIIEEEKKNIMEETESSVISSKIAKKEPKMDLPIFNDKCQLCLSFPITGSKLICLFCNDMVICQDCENLHQHPCIKIKFHCLSDLNTIKRIVNLSQKEANSNNFFKMTKELIFGPSSTFRAKLNVPNNITQFFVNPNTFFSFKVHIQNQSHYILPQNCYLFCLNNKDLNIPITKIEGYFAPKMLIDTNIKFILPNKLANYKLRFVIFHHEVEIECDPLDISINICINEEKYLNDFFKNEERLVNLNKQQKYWIFYVINNELSTKTAYQIALILQKHQWNMEMAIEDLIANDNNERILN